MKKNAIFFALMLIVSAVLFMWKTVGTPVHIAAAVAGIAILVVSAVMTKKQWKHPVGEILMRVLFAVAVVTGILVLRIAGVPAIAIVHKISAAAFVLTFMVTYVLKFVKKA